MALLEDRTAAFIVRVWGERGDGDDTVREWRGSIEHVQSGERTFFRHLEQAMSFMQPHLESIGIDTQQRFWEHIATDIDSAPNTAAALPASPVSTPPPHAALPPRKRR
ncbi:MULTISPECIES: hypothetical protein [Xanthomonas]|uniref:hypothetical protein n=1 Tax=Xanthomonas TaxID=338 RepID=UPI0006F54B0D|nr:MULTISPECIES: hypothetical protein [Xanthomonas]KQR13086.1 hypothetical protein ASF90_07645 [Xanthomonas sp. Leaf148]MEA9587139.1 hypothetical protein [Xanthomonas sp. WHRI 10064B]MEA9616330.1 hypothetical protein [Xanthomonas sp. WHRI 10064A]